MFKSVSYLFILIALFFSMLALYEPEPYYKGELSDHFDGSRFFDPLNSSPHKFGDFIKWKLGSTKAKWPKWIDIKAASNIQERVYGKELKVTWINHATVLLQTQGLNVLTDPVFSERTSPVKWAGPKRVHSPGISLDKLPPIDVVLVSHDHYDALDVPTLEMLWERDKPRIFAGLGVDAIVRKESELDIQLEVLDWWESASLAEDMVVYFTPVQHWSKRWIGDRNYTLWGGFVLESPYGNIYFSGDSGYTDYFKITRDKFEQFRLALIPIGAYAPRWFMAYSHINPEEAVQAFKDLNTDYALGIHWGTFQLTDESREEPIERLASARQSIDDGDNRFRVLEPGDTWWVE